MPDARPRGTEGAGPAASARPAGLDVAVGWAAETLGTWLGSSEGTQKVRPTVAGPARDGSCSGRSADGTADLGPGLTPGRGGRSGLPQVWVWRPHIWGKVLSTRNSMFSFLPKAVSF